MARMVNDAVSDTMREAGVSREAFLGVGVGAPGPLDREKGIVLVAPNLNWHNIPLRDRMTALTGLPAALDNDANCATYGEWWVGAAKGARNVIGMTIGATFMSKDGELVGRDDTAAERKRLVSRPDGDWVCTDKDYAGELAYLKAKCDAGADMIITQMFFDTEVFLQFVRDCRAAGITVPIQPGIMLVQSGESDLLPPDQKCDRVRHRLATGLLHEGAAGASSLDAYEALDFQDSEGFANGGATHARLDHEFTLGR